ncbi:hypothetical protein BGW39_004233 [Mortierella sp. 14UC]|nr:hypothetical protein BGW39_004233 [Mortierella sp. 14UC]
MRGLIPIIGDYVIGVLEMLKHGIYLDRMPQEGIGRVSLAIKYLESKGVQSCERFMDGMSLDPASAVTKTILVQLPPIAALDAKTMEEFKTWIDRWVGESYAPLFPFRISEGDVRWLCFDHFKSMMSDEGPPPRGLESADQSMESARRCLKLAEQMAWSPLFVAFLDWDMSLKDEDELALAIGRLSASVVHILVRQKEASSLDKRAGFDCGYLSLMRAALRNPHFEIFTLSRQKPDTHYDYRDYGEPKSQDGLMMVERKGEGAGMRVILSTSNMDVALISVPTITGGYHVFSELRLALGSFQSGDHFTINFSEHSAARGTAGCDVKAQGKFEFENLSKFVDRRQWSDQVSIVSSLHHTQKVFLAGYLNEATLQVSLKDDGQLIRAFITSNKRLRSLTLHSTELIYDPSQTYETCKQSLFDHPVIEEPKDSTKMRVEIVCNQWDRVEAMFQRYGPLIERLEVEGLSLTDATAIGKLARRKKKPFAPKYISIKDIHLIDPAVREILQDVVVKGAIDTVVVLGSLATQPQSNKLTAKMMEATAKIWVWFLFAIRSKVTELSVRDSPQKRFLEAMASQSIQSLDMPRLTG